RDCHDNDVGKGHSDRDGWRGAGDCDHGRDNDANHDRDDHRNDNHGADKGKDCDHGNGNGGGTGTGGGSTGGTGGTGGVQVGSVSGSVAGDNGAVSGWQIFLIAANGASQSTKTGGDGTFTFANVATGSYTVCEADPSPATEQIPAAGSASNSVA